MNKTILRNRTLRCHRRGTAVVEMAIVAPVLILILMGIIEFAWMFHVKQTMLTASRVGARTASLPGTLDAEILADVDQAMDDANFPQSDYPYTVDITRAAQSNPPGFETVSLAMDYADVSLLGGFFGWLGVNEITASTTYRNEMAAP
ncbi:MAG: pilus assembly protein [Phycisphaerae bacterium]|nr:pilus assembly protein [Phycisphaerae bacterium]